MNYNKALELTRLLRYNEPGLWQLMRVSLHDKGFNIEDCFLAESFQDGENLEYGIMVTRDQKIFEYDFHYEEDESDGRFVEWKDITLKKSKIPYKDEINKAFFMIKERIDV